MANIEQKVADTLELMVLTSEGVLENGNKLESVDNNVNGVGQSVIELHKTAETVIERVAEQGDVLKEMNTNQELVHSATQTLTESVTDTLSLFEENKSVLANIETELKSGNENEETAKTELLGVIGEGHQKYTEKVTEVLSTVSDMKAEITKLDLHADVDTLKQKLENAESKLDGINTSATEHDTTVHERLDLIDQHVNSVIEGLNSLTSETQKIEATFETAIARLNKIDLKLDSVVEAEDDKYEDVSDTMEEINESEVQ